MCLLIASVRLRVDTYVICSCAHLFICLFVRLLGRFLFVRFFIGYAFCDQRDIWRQTRCAINCAYTHACRCRSNQKCLTDGTVSRGGRHCTVSRAARSAGASLPSACSFKRSSSCARIRARDSRLERMRAWRKASAKARR